MSLDLKLTSATVLAKNNPLRFSGESPEYRQARDLLLVDESELRPAVTQSL